MARRGDGIYLRKHTWWLDFQHEGKRHWVRLGKHISRTVARDLGRVKRAAILKGELGIGGRRKDITLEKAAARFLSWAEANTRPNTVKSYRQCLGRLQRAFPGKRLSELHPFLLEKYKRDRLEADAKIAANRDLGTLRALINQCKAWGFFVGDNPASKVRFFRESRGKERIVTAEEEAQLLAAAKEPVRTVILTGLYAGLRVASEALTLRWVDVDLARRTLTVESAHAKSGERRTVPINAVLYDALVRLADGAGPDDFVFRKRNSRPLREIASTFKRLCLRLGIADVTPHALRHTFASRLVMAGTDLETVRELGGWSNLAMVNTDDVGSVSVTTTSSASPNPWFSIVIE